MRAYTSRALERIRALPGVEAAGATTFLPFSWDNSSSVIIPEGYVPAPGESVVSPNQLYVTPGYFEAMRVPLKRGRFFAESDTATRRRSSSSTSSSRSGSGRRRSDRPPDVPAPASGGSRQTRARRDVAPGGRRRGRGQDEGPRRRGGRARRRVLLPVRAGAQRDIAFAIRTTGDPTRDDQGRAQHALGGARSRRSSSRTCSPCRTAWSDR